MHFDFIFRKATVFDGSGARPRIQDVGITGDTITAVGDLSSVQGNTEINAEGLWLTPGFIDAHTHSDAFLLLEPYAPSKLPWWHYTCRCLSRIAAPARGGQD